MSSDWSSDKPPGTAQSAALPGVARLRQALGEVQRRRRLLSALYQGSLLVIGMLAALLALSALSLLLPAVFPIRVLLFLLFTGLCAILAIRCVGALRRIKADDRQVAGLVESRIPDLEQRLLTSMEFAPGTDAAQRGVSRQFVEQLWMDADVHLHEHRMHLEEVSDKRLPLISLGIAAGMAAVVIVSFLLSNALLNASGQLLWPFRGAPDTAQLSLAPIPEPVEIVITVEPGDVRMQRGQAATIVARVENATPDTVQLLMQTDQLNWQEVAMRHDGAGSDGAAYSYYLPAVEDDLVYYVSLGEQGGQRSQQYRISLYDLPRAEQVDVAYDFPDYTGMEDYSEEASGDMVVPEGTRAELTMRFNKPVQQASVVFDDGSSLPVDVDGLTGTAVLNIDRDRSYWIAATDSSGLETSEPDVYYIRAMPDEPPELVLHSPGRDQDVMPLEEVILEVEARDDYGLTEFSLHYSLVGTDEKVIDFLPEEQSRSITGDQLIYMEDLGVQPGDFISYYMTLADNNGVRGAQETVSDIYFLQVIPTDQEFHSSGGGGGQQQGGGGAGGNSSALVTLQKDIISATWRLRQQQLTMDQQQFADDVAVVAESQREAVQRAGMSIDRLSERLDFADDSYGNAVTHLQNAITQMEHAAGELDQEALTAAMSPEQQALQLVLLAEAEINRTDVNFQRTAGGGGGAQQEREDLRELFEMEMGENENRYETPRQANGSQQNSEEASRLEELARRQEGLARAQRNLARRQEDITEEQRRRELERLRREQEQLSNELAQLQQQMSRRQQSQLSQNGQPGAEGGSQMQQMQRALQQMREAAQSESAAQAAARSQRALESLREQQRQMAQQASNASSPNQLAQNIAQRGQQLLQQQRNLQQQLQELGRQQGVGQSHQEAVGSEAVQELLNQQQQNRQDLEEIERMLRAVVARAGNEEQRLLSQAQQASRAIRPLREQMDTGNRVLQSGMVNLAVDIEQEISDSLQRLDQNLQALAPTGQSGNTESGESAIAQASAGATELRQQLETLQQEIDARQQGQPGEESIAQLRDRLSRSQQLSRQLSQQLDAVGDGQQTPDGQARGNQAAGGRSANGSAEANNPGWGRGIPEPGEDEVALWGNARSIQSEITRQSLEDFMNQPELLAGLLQPLVELESDLRARAELAQITRRLYTLSEEDIPDQYRRLVEDYYRALSENRSENRSTGEPEQ